MKRFALTCFCLALLLVAAASRGATCHHFTQEHVDLLSLQWNAASNTLSLMAADDDHGGALYASNQCVVVCPESMKFTLPPGTPLGNEGDPLWILPQSPYAGVPYVGVSAESIPGGTFNDPMTIRLTRVEGPGQFILWQTLGLGQFDVRMDTRDGVDANDSIEILVGGHAHYNWGFTTSGVYRAYFQARGSRPGQGTNDLSPETPFTFHILPLRPFEVWTATNWPCECATNIIAAGADPDADATVNLLEYAFGTDPHVMLRINLPAPGFVSEGGTSFGALSYTWATNATDLELNAVASSSLANPAGWQAITNVHSSVSNSATTRKITVRDHVPAHANAGRSYQLRVRLQ